MRKDLIQKYSEIRENLVKNKEKETTINVSLFDLGMIITGLKMAEAYDDVIDDELNIKFNRGKKHLEELKKK